ncbi:MAG: hypothetical protein HY564_02865 [Candidatus Jacksonbacteria bacterium]|nr:hypothetical protein [Candidatus Jacksonbacteria bacterium]
MKKNRPRSIKRQFISLFIMVIGFFSGAIFFFFIPTFNRIRTDYAEFLKERTEIERLLEEGSTKEKLLKHIDDLSDEFQDLQNGFIVRGKEVEFITFLEDLGSSHNIKQTIQLNEPVVHQKTDFFPFALMSLKMQGTFEDFLRYLTELEQSPYYVNVTSLTITGEDVAVAESEQILPETLSINAMGEVFWLHESET